MNPYDPVNVKFKNTVIMARPVEFEFDSKSEPIRALKLVTTCPDCGAYNEVDVAYTVIDENSLISVVCTQCGATKIPDPILPSPPPPVISKPEVVVNTPKVESIKSKGSVGIGDDGFVSNGVFVDPIALGAFNIEDL